MEPTRSVEMLRPFESEASMTRTRISSTDLNFVFQEQLKRFEDYPFHGIPIAIVPSDRGWRAVVPARDRKHRAEWIEKIEAIEKRLQRTYALEKD
jgi:hypothetical protein